MKYIILFMLGSLTGWLLELVWRKYFGRDRRWVNPGFLSGPYLPIYGFGTIIFYYVGKSELESE